jgi:hypothetical protein
MSGEPAVLDVSADCSSRGFHDRSVDRVRGPFIELAIKLFHCRPRTLLRDNRDVIFHMGDCHLWFIPLAKIPRNDVLPKDLNIAVRHVAKGSSMRNDITAK